MEEKKKRKEKSFNSRCSDGWKLLVRETKLVYSTRATSRCQKKRKKVGVSPTLIISCLVAMYGPFWFSSNLRAVFIDG